jgi:hypothetical protein
MGQSSQVAGTTGTRRLLRALRPIVLLGGFVVVWWFLATGTAQADTGSEHDTRVTRVLARTADRVVDQRAPRTIDGVRHSGHMSPRTVGRTVRHQAAPVAAPVSTTVQRTLVTPIMAGVTDVARPPVTQVLKQTRSILAKAPLARPALGGLDSAAAEDLPSIGEPSTLQGETALSKPGQLAPFSATDAAPQNHELTSSSTTPATGSVVASSTDQGTPASPLGDPRHDRALGYCGTGGASSAQSGSGPSAGGGLIENGLRIRPPTAGTTSSMLGARLPAGRTYPPSSSPD